MHPARLYTLRPTRGFTLIELLTVIAIIGVLASVLIVSIGRVRESAKTANCLSSLRQLQAANLLHAADNRGYYVPVKKNDQWWLTQEAFIRYLDTNKKSTYGTATIIDELKCASASGMISNLSSAWERENFTGHGMAPNGGTAVSPGNFSLVNQNTIANPSKAMAFADGLDFYYYRVPSATYNWEAEQKTSTTISYRHRNGAAIVFLDGHAAWLGREDIEPINDHKALWGK